MWKPISHGPIANGPLQRRTCSTSGASLGIPSERLISISGPSEQGDGEAENLSHGEGALAASDPTNLSRCMNVSFLFVSLLEGSKFYSPLVQKSFVQ
jgi:hypothetical protein